MYNGPNVVSSMLINVILVHCLLLLCYLHI